MCVYDVRVYKHERVRECVSSVAAPDCSCSEPGKMRPRSQWNKTGPTWTAARPKEASFPVPLSLSLSLSLALYLCLSLSGLSHYCDRCELRGRGEPQHRARLASSSSPAPPPPALQLPRSTSRAGVSCTFTSNYQCTEPVSPCLASTR